jgi:hypothetical protein
MSDIIQETVVKEEVKEEVVIKEEVKEEVVIKEEVKEEVVIKEEVKEEVVIKEEVAVKEEVKEEVAVKEEVKEEVVNDLLTVDKSQEIKEPTDILDPTTTELTPNTFQQIFENLLSTDTNTLNITIKPEIKQYLLLLCKNNEAFFVDVEESLKKIIIDNKINTKDIAEIMILVTKIYEQIKARKQDPKIDPYEIINTLLHTLFLVYFQANNVDNPELEDIILHIIDVSLRLIKLQSFTHSKKGCLSSIFKF